MGVWYIGMELLAEILPTGRAREGERSCGKGPPGALSVPPVLPSLDEVHQRQKDQTQADR